MGVPRLVRSNRLGRSGDRRGRIRGLPTNDKGFVRWSTLDDPSITSLDPKIRENNQFRQLTFHEKLPGVKTKTGRACSGVLRCISRESKVEVDNLSPLRRQEGLMSLQW